MTCLGALINRRLGIHPRRFDDWYELPNLWSILVAPAGWHPVIVKKIRILSVPVFIEKRTSRNSEAAIVTYMFPMSGTAEKLTERMSRREGL